MWVFFICLVHLLIQILTEKLGRDLCIEACFYIKSLDAMHHLKGNCHGKKVSLYWASEASPTLGCSIEISCDIYIYKTYYMGQRGI